MIVVFFSFCSDPVHMVVVILQGVIVLLVVSLNLLKLLRVMLL